MALLALLPLSVAVSVAVPASNAVTGKVALVWPAGTMTVSGAWSSVGALFVSGTVVLVG